MSETFGASRRAGVGAGSRDQIGRRGTMSAMFLDGPLSPLAAFDLLLIAAVALALPLYVAVSHRAERCRRRQGLERRRMAEYRETFVILWALTIVILASWIAGGRPRAELGLAVSGELGFVATFAAAALVSAAFASQLLLARSPKARAALAEQLRGEPGLDEFRPRTPREQAMMRVLSLTAGITEEIIYRGFLIWALAHWMPLAAAVAVALAAFTAAHVYQETPSAIFGVALLGAILTAAVIISGSLVPAMLIHAAVDLTSVELAWAAQKAQEREAAEAPAGGD